MQVSIVQSYMELKLAELRLEHELEEKKRAVVEEQRRVRDQMREQERAQRELDTAKEELRWKRLGSQRLLTRLASMPQRRRARSTHGSLAAFFNLKRNWQGRVRRGSASARLQS